MSSTFSHSRLVLVPCTFARRSFTHTHARSEHVTHALHRLFASVYVFGGAATDSCTPQSLHTMTPAHLLTLPTYRDQANHLYNSLKHELKLRPSLVAKLAVLQSERELEARVRARAKRVQTSLALANPSTLASITSLRDARRSVTRRSPLIYETLAAHSLARREFSRRSPAHSLARRSFPRSP